MRVYKVKESNDILEYELVDITDLSYIRKSLLEVHGYAFDDNNQIICNIDHIGHYSAKYIDLNVVSKQIICDLRDYKINSIDETI